MKEKYIFSLLLIIALGMLIASVVNKHYADEASSGDLAIEKKWKLASGRQPLLPSKIDIDAVQNLIAFSEYEQMIVRSPFLKIQPKSIQAAETKLAALPVGIGAPQFVYKGKILSGKRMLVIIEQTHSGETLMVSKGEDVDGYKVLDITETEVILSSKGKEDIVLKTMETP